MASHAWCRIRRVVDELIGFCVHCWSARITRGRMVACTGKRRSQDPIAHHGCGMSSARQIPFLILRISQWPLCGAMPFVLSHLKVVDAGSRDDAVIFTLEEVIKPREHQFIDRAVGNRANSFESWTYGTVWTAPSQMLPRANHDALVIPREFIGTVRAHSVKVSQGTIQEGIVPALECQYWHIDLAVP